MKFDIQKTFRYYFPSPYEMFMTGVPLLFLALPAVALLFVRHDMIFSESLSGLREVAIAWGCVTAAAGFTLLFIAVRTAATVGTAVYRLTHPRLFRGRR